MCVVGSEEAMWSGNELCVTEEVTTKGAGGALFMLAASLPF